MTTSIHRLVRGLVAGALLAGLAGCGSYVLQRVTPGTSSAQVRQLAGAPTEERTLGDGTKAWYYVDGPGGWKTYRLRIGPDDRVQDTTQVLTERNFREQLVAGQTSRRQVEDALGTPGLVMQFPNLREEVLTYRWMDVTFSMKLDVHTDASNGIVMYYTTYRDPCPSGPLWCSGT